MSQNDDFLIFLDLGNFLFEIGKKHTFCHWEHDPIKVAENGPKNP